VKEAREYLLKHGFVFTLRGNMRRTGKDIAVQGSYKKHKNLGKVNIEFTGEISYVHQLNPWYMHSGFDSPKAWFDTATKMHKGKLPLYLFRVDMIYPEMEPALKKMKKAIENPNILKEMASPECYVLTSRELQAISPKNISRKILEVVKEGATLRKNLQF